jgi:hypothetical protein
MSAAHIYLDEKGDLGFNFSAPYRAGGSSRFLTVGALIVPSDISHLPGRVIKRLHKSRGWTVMEKKWNEMNQPSREEFVERAGKFIDEHAGVSYYAITVRKEKVSAHIQGDPNKLYNYMVKCLLLDKMSSYDEVQMIPDPRSIKVESGNSMHDYLQTVLWFDKGAKTVLTTTPLNSEGCKGLHFADMLTGLVGCHHEDADSLCWDALKNRITAKTLFF